MSKDVTVLEVVTSDKRRLECSFLGGGYNRS